MGAATQKKVHTRLRVLLIEDNPVQRRMLRAMLEKHSGASFEFESAETLKQGCALGMSGAIDVALLDLGLPDSEGLNTLAAFTRSCPRVAVVVLSANDNEGLAIESVLSGAESYLVKGAFDQAVLLRTVRQAYERKLAEEALKQSEAYWRDTFRSIRDGLAIIDRNGVIARCNDAMARIIGRTTREIVGNRCYELIHGADGHIADCPLLRSQQSLQRESMEQQRGERWYRVVVDPIIDRDGKVAGAVHIMTDVTEARTAHRRLMESEERFRTLWHTIDVGVVLSDPDSHSIVDANEVALRMLQADSDAVLGKPCDRFLRPDAERFGETMQQHGCVLRSESEILRIDGAPVAVLKSMSRIELAGKQLVLESFVDVSDRKRAETSLRKRDEQIRQAQKLEAIGVLAGGIAHDFNNILGAIIGYSELVLGSLESGTRAHTNLKQVVIAGRRAAELVRQILTFSRQTESEKRPLDLRLIVNEALKLLRATVPSTVAIDQDLAREAGMVLADPTQMHQVLMNLCTNAAQAMRGQQGCLTVTLKRVVVTTGAPRDDLPAGDYMLLSIEDTGIGMDAQTMGQIFDPFFSTKEPGEGSGLGLAVVHGIVAQHNGSLRVWSEAGSGARFDVYLPVVEEAGPLPTLSAMPLAEGKGEHVLLVDDEEALVQLGAEILREHGYEVTACSQSREAWAAFQQAPERFHLILTDMTMPGLTGLQLAGRCLGLRPDIPVLLCTGYSDSVSPEKAREVGIRRFLNKPLGSTELVQAVRGVLDEVAAK